MESEFLNSNAEYLKLASDFEKFSALDIFATYPIRFPFFFSSKELRFLHGPSFLKRNSNLRRGHLSFLSASPATGQWTKSFDITPGEGGGCLITAG